MVDTGRSNITIGRRVKYNGGGGEGHVVSTDMETCLNTEHRVTTTLSLTEISTKYRYYACTLS